MKMGEAKFSCCTFEGVTKIVALSSGDSKQIIINAFGITLEENQDIIISDIVSEALIDSKDLFSLVCSLRLPTDLKFIVRSRFPHSIITKFSLFCLPRN